MFVLNIFYKAAAPNGASTSVMPYIISDSSVNNKQPLTRLPLSTKWRGLTDKNNN
jgi:hypothetical protein